MSKIWMGGSLYFYMTGVAMDESEVNKRSELEICCNISSESDVESRHYKCVDLQAGDAETICNTLIGEMVEDKIPYKEKMLSLDLEGCSTMQGCMLGVITRMVREVPELSSLGSSNAHDLSNAMMHGVTAAFPDFNEALVDLYQDLGGAKGRGLKKKQFEELALAMGVKVTAFKRFVSTRFRTLRTCIGPALAMFLVIVAYYKGVKKPWSNENRKSCTKCQQGSRFHNCHCDEVKIDEEMRRCKTAYVGQGSGSNVKKKRLGPN